MNSDEIIEKLRVGELTIEDADEVSDIDGLAVEASFLGEDGRTTIHYTYFTAYRPQNGTSTLEEFKLFD